MKKPEPNWSSYLVDYDFSTESEKSVDAVLEEIRERDEQNPLWMSLPSDEDNAFVKLGDFWPPQGERSGPIQDAA